LSKQLEFAEVTETEIKNALAELKSAQTNALEKLLEDLSLHYPHILLETINRVTHY